MAKRSADGNIRREKTGRRREEGSVHTQNKSDRFTGGGPASVTAGREEFLEFLDLKQEVEEGFVQVIGYLWLWKVRMGRNGRRVSSGCC